MPFPLVWKYTRNHQNSKGQDQHVYNVISMADNLYEMSSLTFSEKQNNISDYNIFQLTGTLSVKNQQYILRDNKKYSF